MVIGFLLGFWVELFKGGFSWSLDFVLLKKGSVGSGKGSLLSDDGGEFKMVR